MYNFLYYLCLSSLKELCFVLEKKRSLNVNTDGIREKPRAVLTRGYLLHSVIIVAITVCQKILEIPLLCQPLSTSLCRKERAGVSFLV